MIKVLFLIHDLGQGGAEKVLVNLVNHLDKGKFDVTVISLFGGGVNEKYLNESVRYKTIYPFMIPANSKWMKFFSPEYLHDRYIKEHYDIEIAFLEGPSARIISGCRTKGTKLFCWIHQTFHSPKGLSSSFRSYKEACACYNRFHSVIFVSEGAKKAFLKYCSADTGKCEVLYNTNDTNRILAMAEEKAEDLSFDQGCVTWCGVGKLEEVKRFDRMIRIQEKLQKNGYKTRLYILGDGSLRKKLESLAASLGVSDTVTFLGYQDNPYKYIARFDLMACSSYSEGFSTAVTEALILGVPVCTVEVSGMRELLGTGSEYGLITDNNEDDLYEGIEKMVSSSEIRQYYRERAEERGKMFSIDVTVAAVEDKFSKAVKNM